MKKLVLGILPKDFSPKTHVVLGPWSFLEKQSLLLNNQVIHEPDPYPDIASLKLDADISNILTDQLLNKCTSHLNDINGTTYSRAFWQVMLSSWLSTIIQISIERYKRIYNLLKKYPNERFSVELVRSENISPFKNTKHFFSSGVFSIYFNHWLLSRLIEMEDNNLFHIKYMDSKIDLKAPKNDYTIKNRILNRLISFFPSYTIYGINLFQSLLIEIFCLRKKIKTNVEKSLKEKIVLTEYDKINWEYIIFSTLPEEFKKIKSVSSFPKPRAIFTGQRFFYQLSAKYKMRIALHKHVGSKIYCFQHGSRYGMLESTPYINDGEYCHDGFISWGWKTQSNYKANIYALPTPYLIYNTSKKLNNSIVFIGQHASLINYRLDSVPQPGQQVAIFKDFLKFKKEVSLEYFDKLDLKFHPDTQGALNYKLGINHFDNSYRIVPKKNDEIFESRLMVIDHPGTLFIKRMSANLPVIIYFREDMWGLSKQANEVFGAIKKSGIYFNNPEDAANKINEISADLESWWNHKSVQDSVQKWIFNYGRVSKLWKSEWYKFFKEV